MSQVDKFEQRMMKHYTSWASVPAHLKTKTQLSELSPRSQQYRARRAASAQTQLQLI